MHNVSQFSDKGLSYSTMDTNKPDNKRKLERSEDGSQPDWQLFKKVVTNNRSIADSQYRQPNRNQLDVLSQQFEDDFTAPPAASKLFTNYEAASPSLTHNQFGKHWPTNFSEANSEELESRHGEDGLEKNSKWSDLEEFFMGENCFKTEVAPNDPLEDAITQNKDFNFKGKFYSSTKIAELLNKCIARTVSLARMCYIHKKLTPREYKFARAIIKDKGGIRQQLVDGRHFQQADFARIDAKEEAIKLAKAEAETKRTNSFYYRKLGYTSEEIKDILNINKDKVNTFCQMLNKGTISDKAYKLVKALAENKNMALPNEEKSLPNEEKSLRQMLLEEGFVQQAELDEFDARQKLREQAMEQAKAEADAEKAKLLSYNGNHYTTVETKKILNLSETIKASFFKMKKNGAISKKEYELILGIKSDHHFVRKQLLDKRHAEQADLDGFVGRLQAREQQVKATGKPGRKARAKAQVKIQK